MSNKHIRSSRRTVASVVLAALSALALLLLAPSAATAAPGDETAYPPALPSSPTLSIGGTPSSGATVPVTGANFRPGETADIYVLSDAIFLLTAVADANGGFTVNVTLPQLEPGSHSIEARGNQGSIAEARFVVAGTGGAAGNGTTTGGDQLAWTGAAVGSLVVLAIGLLIAGTVVLLSGKRRASA